METYTNFKKFSADKVIKYWRDQLPHTSEENFNDPLFPHNINSLHAKNSNGEFLNPIYEKLSQEINTNIEWKSARDIFGLNYSIFKDKIEPADLKQRNLGDCYFISTLAAITEFPHYIYQLFRTKNVSHNGYYEIVMFLDGEWQIVIVDDYFIVKEGTNDFEFSLPNGNEIWVPLLEKAWAKVNRGYAAIIGGWPNHPLTVLTGFPCNTLIHENINSDELWNTLLKYDNNNKIMVTTTKTDSDIEKYGLVARHAYTLIGAKEISYENINLKMVKIRNPWGYGEWTGDWSDNSPLWNEEIKSLLNYENSNDGIFFMTLNDFTNMFYRTDVCYTMFDSFIKILKIQGEALMSPQVYNLLLEEDGDIAITLNREFVRYNHKNIEENPCPFSLIITRYDNQNGNLCEFIGKSETFFDIEIIKFLKKGLYCIWVYCSYECCNPIKPIELKLRIISHIRYRIKHIDSDSNLKLIKEILETGIKDEYKDEIDSQDYFYKIENSFKNSGLGFIYFKNKFDKFTWNIHYDTSEILNYQLFKPYDQEKKFDVKINPMKSHLVFGIRTSSYYFFNCHASNEFECFNDNTEQNSENIHIHNYVCMNRILDEIISENYYDYYSLNVIEATEQINFEKTYSDIDIRNLLKEKYPSIIIDELEKLEAVEDDEKLTWSCLNMTDYIYIGQLNNNQIRNGRGAYYWPNHEMFRISYFNNGLGGNWVKMGYTNGYIYYQGGFMNNMMHGHGEFFFQNGDIYRGEFVDNKKNGKGVYRWSSGNEWHGNFIDDNLSGKGVLYPVGSEPYEYEFK